MPDDELLSHTDHPPATALGPVSDDDVPVTDELGDPGDVEDVIDPGEAAADDDA